MFEMIVTHESMGHAFLVSNIKVTRERGALDAVVNQLYAELFDKFLVATELAPLLPAVAEFAALRARAAEMDADLHRIELDRQAADLDKQRLHASGIGGEKLAVALSAAEEKHQAAAQRLRTSQAGSKSFHASLAKSETAAREAIQSHVTTAIMAKIEADHASRQESARQRLIAAAGPILDEMAALDQAGTEIFMRRDLDGRIDEVLRTVKATGKR
jgi:hypothetical protein